VAKLDPRLGIVQENITKLSGYRDEVADWNLFLEGKLTELYNLMLKFRKAWDDEVKLNAQILQALTTAAGNVVSEPQHVKNKLIAELMEEHVKLPAGHTHPTDVDLEIPGGITV